MSEEFCDGVKILLKRMESNPEEFKDSTKWEWFISGHNIIHGYWANVLSPEETKALAEGVRHIFRDLFTEKVMATLLEDKEEKLAQVQPGTWVNVSSSGGGGSGMLGSPYQNTYNAFTNQTNTEVKKPTLGEMLKAKLAIL